MTIRKGLRLIGDRPDLVSETGVLIEGSVRVLGLPPNHSFVGTDLFLPGRGAGPHIFSFENCQGNVHLAESVGRLVVRQCNYVTVDVVESDTGDLNEPGVLIEDSFLIATNSSWNSPYGVLPMEAFRSKVILVGCILRNVNSLGQLIPANSAIELTDSEMVYTGDTEFIVWCDPGIQMCPPDIGLHGNSTTEKEDRGASAVFVDIRNPDFLRVRYGSGNSSVFALVVGFPIRPLELDEGTLAVNVGSSILLHLCPPPPPFAFVTVDIPMLPENRFGIPITFQAAALMLGGEIS